MATIPEALAIALEHHKAGRLQAAEQIYRQILAADPKQADAIHLLGVAAHQRGQHEVAVDHIRRAIGLRPKEPAYYNNLAEAYRAWGRSDEAIECYQRALQLKPDYAEAHNNLGNAWKAQGKLDQALACYQRALELKPRYAEAYANLGNVWQDLGKPVQAIECYRQALQLQPSYVAVHMSLGAVWQAQGKLEQAIECYQRALELQPDNAAVHNELGIAWRERGSAMQARECFQRAAELRPEFAAAQNNLGIVWQEQGKLEQAIECYQRAVQLQPDLAVAHNNLGNIWKDQGRFDLAIDCYREAVRCRPDYTAALGELIYQLQNVCAWDEVDARAAQLIALVEDRVARPDPVSPLIFVTLAIATTASQQLQCARKWGEGHLQGALRVAATRPFSHSPQIKPRITLGYLSADFHGHATSWLIAEMIERHDRRRFTVHGYSYGRDDGSPTRQRMMKAFDRFADLRGLAFGEAGECIARDGVDILIDLKGYTGEARTEILALRPAPIQVNYLGYPGTMGASFMDYILVDHFVVPPDQQPCFSEQLVHLPGCYQVNDSRREIASRTPSRAECGLPETGFVFCSFNNSYKITPAVFAVWMGLLRAVPGSVLWLLEGNRFVSGNLRREAVARGVAAERLVFAPRLPMPEHLARHRLADLFLDTCPVAAHTTASDALWAGCPLLTMAGQTFVSRVAGSLLQTIGLPELIVQTLAEYEETALHLAREPARLLELRARLASNRLTCGLFDGARFARHVEQAYERMWEIYTSGGKPRAFEVAPLPCSP